MSETLKMYVAIDKLMTNLRSKTHLIANMLFALLKSNLKRCMPIQSINLQCF